MRPLLILGFSICTLVGCGSQQSPSEDKLVITGSSTVAPLVAEIAKRYEQQAGDIRIDVQTGGSSRGVSDARSRLADVGMVSRGLKSSEVDLVPHTIAIDGIAVVVHADNPVSTISKAQLVQLYRGDIKHWAEISASASTDSNVVVVSKAQGRSTLELFLKYTGLSDRDVAADIVIGDNEQGIKTVSGNPNAIGYVSIGAAQYNIESGAALKMLTLEGVSPSTANVRNGSYPLTRPLNLVTDNMPKTIAEEFIAYARSEQVNDLVRGLYFVPLMAEPAQVAAAR